MKCISCESEINPKWKAAIEKNCCPNCGEKIVEEELKELLNTLRSTLDQLNSNYSEQLDDWLLSNYNYIKTNSSKLSEFLPDEDKKQIYSDLKQEEKDQKFEETKKKTVKVKDADGKIQDVEVEQLVSDEKNSEFFKRAEVKLQNDQKKFRNFSERTQYLQEIKKKIETGENSSEMANMTITDTFMADQDGEISENEYSQMIDGGEEKEVVRDSSGEPIPSFVLNMSKQANKNKPQPSLNDIKNKVDASKDNFNSGMGKFSRI